MPSLNIPEETFRRLSARAAALNISVDELVNPVLDRLADAPPESPEAPLPLIGEAWQAELAEWRRDAERRARQYPPDFVLDDSRETIYREREDAQR